MSIFNLFRSTEKQEETNIAYQAWREENPDNPSDDDFYQDDDNDDETEDQSEEDYLASLPIPWWC